MLDLLHYLSVDNFATQSQSPWRPLRTPLFRKLLIADLVSDIGTFMHSVGAAWLMTSLTTNLMYVALIQTASGLPFFVLASPAASIGDIFDRSVMDCCSGFFGVGAVIGAVVLQRARSKLSVDWVVSGATVLFAGVILALATLHRLPLLCFLILFGGAAWTVFMSTFNTHTLGRCCGTYERKHSAAVFEHWHCRLLGASRCCAIARGKGFVGLSPAATCRDRLQERMRSIWENSSRKA